MSMIKRIVKLNNFGSFHDFISEENTKDFTKYNLFFGLNGTGKSTIAKLFSFLSKGFIENEYRDYYKENFEIIDNENTHLNTFANNKFIGKIKVFDQEFINKNLSLSSTNAETKCITYNISETSKDLNDKIKNLEEDISSHRIEKFGKIFIKSDCELNDARAKLDECFKINAEHVRNALNIENSAKYRSNHFENDYNLFKEENIDIDDNKKANAVRIYHLQEKEHMYFLTENCLTKNKFDEINTDLKTSIVRKTTIKEDLANWLEAGLKFVEGKNCPFCGTLNVDWEKRIPELREILKKDDTYSNFEAKLNDNLNFLEDLIKTSEQSVILNIKSDDFMQEIKKETIENYKKCNKNYITFLSNIKTKIKNKISNKELVIELPSFDTVYNYESILKEVKSIIEEHENLLNNLSKNKKKAFKDVIKYYVKISKPEIEDLKDKIQQFKSEQEKEKQIVANLHNQLAQYKAELSNQKLPIEKIENYLNRILQNDSLSLRFVETTQSYSVVRKNGVIAKNLSEGEKSAIAFAYFLATLQEKDFNLSESIIVIDDPVSSLDQQYLFNIVNLIARCFNKEKSFNQLFVFSHNFYFFKKLRTILNYKNEKDKEPKFNIYEIVKDCNLNSSIINANKYLTNYQSEYLYLIQKLRENLQNCSENELIFAGNSIRKVLEIFLSFRDPKDKGMNARFENVIKTISEDKRYSFDYLQDIVNACSHTDEITDLDDSDDFKLFVNKNMIQQLFDFIELADKEHFKALK